MTTRDAFTPEEWTTCSPAPGRRHDRGHGGQRGDVAGDVRRCPRPTRRRGPGTGRASCWTRSWPPSRRWTTRRTPRRRRSATEGLQRLRAAVALVQGKATPEELDGYRGFVLAVADKVAGAHREDDQVVSPGEAEAIDQIREAVGATSA